MNSVGKGGAVGPVKGLAPAHFFPLESGLPAKSQLCNDYKLLSTVHVFYLYGHAGLYSMTGETKPIMADPYFPSTIHNDLVNPIMTRSQSKA